MSELIVHGGKRVLTSVQLAEPFGTNAKVINRNFSRNQNQFVEGEHYFQLTGDVLKAFKAERPNDASLKFTASLNLWTEKGAWLHASYLKGSRAKEALHTLIDGYYNILEQPQHIVPNQAQPLAITYEHIQQIESRLEVVEKQLRESTLHSGEQTRLRIEVTKRVNQLVGNKKDARGALFRAIYSSIKERYQVGSYRDVKQHELQDALRFVAQWGGDAS